MNYTVLFVIMSIAFLVAIGVIYTDTMAIREKIETIHKLDMKLIQTLHDSNRTMDQELKTAIAEWKETIAGWKRTLEVCDDLLAELKRVTERRE